MFDHSNKFDDAAYMCLLAASRNKLKSPIPTCCSQIKLIWHLRLMVKLETPK